MGYRGATFTTILFLILTNTVFSNVDLNSKCLFSSNKQILTCDYSNLDYSNPQNLLGNDTHVLILKNSNNIQLNPHEYSNDNWVEITNYQLIGHKHMDITPEAFRSLLGLRYFKIERSNWNTVRGNTFYGLDNLEMLNILGNGIEVLEEKAFAGLRSLITLELTYNNFPLLPSTVFEDLGSLTSLLLSNNNIQVIEDHAFIGLSDLTILDLSCNTLKQITANHFEVMPKLSHLYLSGNDISYIEGSFKSNSLKFLYLQSNELTAIDDELFKEAANLTEIDIASNKLTSLSEKPFRDLSHLVHLHVRGNNISDLTALKKLQLLYLTF